MNHDYSKKIFRSLLSLFLAEILAFKVDILFEKSQNLFAYYFYQNCVKVDF